MKLLLSLVASWAVLLGAQDACSGKCPSVTTQHYTSNGCTPVSDPAIDACCPTQYTCPSAAELGRSPTTCYYKGKTYQLGEEVPVVNECHRGCQCRKSHREGAMAEIECASVECGERGHPLSVGCRHLYSSGQCCSTGLECNEVIPPSSLTTNSTIRKPDCEANGIPYLYGQRMYFPDRPCRTCVCSKEYQGPDQEPSCTPIDCGLDTSYRHYLDAGCTPLYLNGTCCPTDYICPESPAIVYDEERQVNATDITPAHCALGTMVATKGESLDMVDCHHVCLCLTPPLFTCVRYPTCSDALYARKRLESF